MQPHAIASSGIGLRCGAALLAALQVFAGFPQPAFAQEQDNSSKTATPIKHVIVIIGENRTFDHVFATYKPVRGQKVDNLLSKGIVNADGTPGPNYSYATQYSAEDTHRNKYEVSPQEKSFYPELPAPLAGGPTTPYVSTLAQAKMVETGLPDDTYYSYLTTGGTGLKAKTPDTRIPNVNSLPAGPFQITPGIPYDAYAGRADSRYKCNKGDFPAAAEQPDTEASPTRLESPNRAIEKLESKERFPLSNSPCYDGTLLISGGFSEPVICCTWSLNVPSPVHRFYQMWQQLDCNAAYATKRNPSGCRSDLFPYVEVTVGAGANGQKRPTPFTEATTGEGGLSMGFYNMQQGDAPYLKYLADHYAMSDNYHQAVMGGTGANHIALGTGDAIWFSDGNGNPVRPPHKQLVAAGTPNAGVVDEVENPNPAPKTDNWYKEDGYGGGSYGSASYGGGSYSNCSDSDQPGVASVLNYLSILPYQVDPKCSPGRYYLLNNYNPGYFGNGQNAYTDTSKGNTVFTVPPSTLRNIGDALLEKNISWKYYGDQWNLYVNDPYYLNPANAYCNICNFFQYSTSIMTNAAVRTAHLKDTVDLYQDIQNGVLPAVSFVKPSGLVDGHPASSKLNLFEGFVKKIVDGVQSNPALWKDTAIIVTTDEGGGYYDSGYVQPVDFFGDGTRIPLIVVSRFNDPGKISHQYNDHVSILKFIEKNWGLDPLTKRSRDNLPNPKQYGSNPYVPANSPAIGDLMNLFDFTK